MKLDTFDGITCMTEPHDDMVIGFRCYLEFAWQIIGRNNERMIPGGNKRALDAFKKA